MPQPPPRYLVVGADSMVGSALIARLWQTGASVSGTTRKRGQVSERLLYLDLADPVQAWRPPQSVDVAILCAGVTRMQTCKDNPIESAKINVEGISQLAGNLHREGVFVIYLSTNQVFDGSVPFRSPHDPPCPITEYGRQKAEAERRLTEGGAACAIVRFTKILGPRIPLFSGWAQAFRSGQGVQAYSDTTLAPVPLSCAITVLLLVAVQRLSGVFHVSGDQDISYEAAARLGAKSLGADPRLVQPVKTVHDRADNEPMPAHTTLDTSVLKSALGIVPPEVQWTVETAFVNPQLLGGA